MTGFTAYFTDEKKPRVLYGLGKNTKELLPQISHYNIVGLMDGKKKDGSFAGIPIIDLDGLPASGVKEIILMAQPLSRGILYRRLAAFCRQQGIRILDMEGNDLTEIFREDGVYHPYYSLGWADLREACESADIVTFDVFDTLVMRDILYPDDIFEIMEKKLGSAADLWDCKDGFAGLRIRIEKALFSQGPYPNIHQIYDGMQQEAKFDDVTKERLMALELETELEHILPRRTMVDFFHEIRKDKDVYLISDMYLTKDMIERILYQCGCDGYRGVFVSSQYAAGKREGLFDIFKEKTGAGRYCLHIGDSQKADYEGARRAGLGSFRIMSGAEMLVYSNHGHRITEDMTLEQRMETGAWISEALNDPFALQGKKGKVG